MRALILTMALAAAAGIAWFAWAPAAAQAAPVRLCVAGMEVHLGQRDSAIRLAMSETLKCGEERPRLISVSIGAAAAAATGGGVEMIATPI